MDNDQVVECFDYDPASGNVYWAAGRRRAGLVAGSRHKSGYWVININLKTITAHRLAWRIIHGEWPRLDIDHINGVRDDNRLCNLRLATRSQNQQNRRAVGRRLKGVTRQGKSYQAQIKFDGKQHYLGVFSTEAEAHAVYLAKAIEVFGEFARAS